MRRAEIADIPELLDLMSEFYAEAGYQLDRAHAARAFADVIGDERLGYIWLLTSDRQDVGHAVIVLRYAMEYGGMIACLDDLYVRSAFRGRGIAGAALGEIREFCRENGIRAMTVEVGFHNAAAQKVYRRAGFVELSDRELLALALAAPTHVE